MGKSEKLTSQQISTGTQGLSSWKVNQKGHLEAEFKFKNFPEAFSFMTRIAFEAEELDHHPDWSNSYNRVRIELTTHDSGGLTENDLELARRISAIDWS